MQAFLSTHESKQHSETSFNMKKAFDSLGEYGDGIHLAQK